MLYVSELRLYIVLCGVIEVGTSTINYKGVWLVCLGFLFYSLIYEPTQLYPK